MGYYPRRRLKCDSCTIVTMAMQPYVKWNKMNVCTSRISWTRCNDCRNRAFLQVVTFRTYDTFLRLLISVNKFEYDIIALPFDIRKALQRARIPAGIQNYIFDFWLLSQRQASHRYFYFLILTGSSLGTSESPFQLFCPRKTFKIDRADLLQYIILFLVT